MLRKLQASASVVRYLQQLYLFLGMHCTALRNKDRRGGGRKQASQTEIQSISIRTPITSRDVQIIMAKDYEDDDDDAPAADG